MSIRKFIKSGEPINPEPKPKPNRLARILEIIMLPIIGVILTLFFQQYFFKSNKRAEESIKIEAEYVKQNLALLNQIKKYQEISKPFNNLHIGNNYSLPNESVYATDSIGFNIQLPEIAIDTSNFYEWEGIFKQIQKNESLLDRDLFTACKDLYNFLQSNPLPKNYTDYEQVEISGWNDKEIKGRWETLNKILEIKIDRRLAIIKENDGLEF